MIARDSADARAALMANYFSRYPYLQAGTKTNESYTPLQHKGNILSQEGKNRLAIRGRTIYNAHHTQAPEEECLTALEKLRRIDEDERRRKEELMAMTNLPCSRRYSTEMQISDVDDVTVREMFDLYIRAEEFA
ncbi:hypothetical protein SCLCIDRAFT_1211514 [Scleroderma citrinum Foug A]|uniref:Uncharacterized protein n=1 Tax=Scleroderma citrinum Foug A TaxID=1036808 RepID=A0A0C3AMS9_9AGAM|nr:hypothetical protein SCLCIDRAFT_1211514 [Scleroderma citrinum Foug A]